LQSIRDALATLSDLRVTSLHVDGSHIPWPEAAPGKSGAERSLHVVTRLLLICLCLGVLSTVTGCFVEFPSYGTSSSGGETAREAQPYSKQWARWDEMYHPWNRPTGYYAE
jgi:hypothetical protein